MNGTTPYLIVTQSAENGSCIRPVLVLLCSAACSANSAAPLYDQDRQYLLSEGGPLLRQPTLLSDVSTVDDAYESGAEWKLELVSPEPKPGTQRYRFKHRKTEKCLGSTVLVDGPQQAVAFSLEPAQDCAEHPELNLDAEGAVAPRTFEDGSL